MSLVTHMCAHDYLFSLLIFVRQLFTMPCEKAHKSVLLAIFLTY